MIEPPHLAPSAAALVKRQIMCESAQSDPIAGSDSVVPDACFNTSIRYASIRLQHGLLD